MNNIELVLIKVKLILQNNCSVWTDAYYSQLACGLCTRRECIFFPYYKIQDTMIIFLIIVLP